MNPPEPADRADQAFLDAALDRLLREWAEGRELDVEALIAERPDLASDLAALFDMAREAAVLRPQALPKVPGYQILHELGRGGMGIVYAARQIGLDRLVALKVLPAISADSDHARRRFLSEARGLARMRHVHIVSIFDVVEAGESCAYAMELIDGKSLADLLHELRPWSRQGPAPHVRFGGEGSAQLPVDPVVWFCRVGIGVARALGTMHQRGLVHRDVKPSNILLRADGTPLLSDFGLVRDEGPQRTRPGQVVGTIAFAPPEQLTGDLTRVGPASDVFALGATLHWALAGAPPFLGQTSSELQASIEARARSSLTRARLPPDLDTIIGKCLEPRIEDRYASGNDVADDLENLLALRPISARPLGIAPRALRMLRRNRRLVVVALCSAMLVLIASVLVGLGLWRNAQVPVDFERHLRAARRALLDPYYDERAARVARSQTLRAAAALARVEAALRLYDKALSLAPERIDIAREREVTALASTHLSAQVERERRDASSVVPSEAWLSSHLAEDPRLRGLHAFLVGDVQACQTAWEGLDLLPGAWDPLVEAAAGQQRLGSNDFGGAWLRLQRAFDAWPEEGFLAVAIAQCAVHCGELITAERFLARAEALGAEEQPCLLARAELRVAQGRDLDARDDYGAIRWELTLAAQSCARVRYAQFLVRGNEADHAVDLLLNLVEGAPDGVSFASNLLEVADAWWTKLGSAGQVDALVQAWNSLSWPRLHRLADAQRRLEESRDSSTATARIPSSDVHRQHGPIGVLPLELIMLTEVDCMRMRRIPESLQRIVAAFVLGVREELRGQVGERASRTWMNVQRGTRAWLMGLCLALAPASNAHSQVQWAQRAPNANPSARTFPRAAFDPARGEVVVYGGNANLTVLNDFWSWDGGRQDWTQITQPNSPGPRTASALVQESATSLILFSGLSSTNGTPAMDTWRWNGSSWLQLSPPQSPPARHAHAMAYDSHRGVVVLFGGAANGTNLDDTWEWDGSTWTHKQKQGSWPLALANHGMVYDPVRRRVLLFGGHLNATFNFQARNDTWEWDGTNWTQQVRTIAPSPRSEHGMCWDTARSCAVVFGGEPGGPYAPMNDLWEWDGSSWTQRTPVSSTRPPANAKHSLVYDPLRRQTVLFGGEPTYTTYSDDTWILEPVAHADFTLTGPGCSGILGTPSLAAEPGSLPWIGQTFTARVTSIPNQFPLPIFVVGLSNPATSGLLCRMNCTLRALPDFTFVLAPRGNQATWSILIPSDPNLLGANQIFTQVVVFNFVTACFDAMSNGMQMTIGAR